MTEQEWLTTDNFPAMMIALRGTVPDAEDGAPTRSLHGGGGTLFPGPAQNTTPSRLRAFATACLPKWRELPLDPISDEVINAYEAFLNGTGSLEAFRERCMSLQDLPADAPRPRPTAFSWAWDDTPYGIGQLTWNLASSYAGYVAREQIAELEQNATEDDRFAWGFFGYSGIPLWSDTNKSLYDEFRSLLRETIGNPFRPIAFDHAWRTSTAVWLAQGMYDSRDFLSMLILADALQDAGCDNDDVLNHCRDANGVHVRGCWVVDLVLEKS